MESNDDTLQPSLWDKVTTSESCIAAALYTLCKDRHRYVGRGKWEFLEQGELEWKADKDKLQLRRSMINASTQALERAMFWFEKRQDVDAVLKQDTLMCIVNKLKSVQSQNAIMKEAKDYFVAE